MKRIDKILVDVLTSLGIDPDEAQPCRVCGTYLCMEQGQLCEIQEEPKVARELPALEDL